MLTPPAGVEMRVSTGEGRGLLRRLGRLERHRCISRELKVLLFFYR